jgi:hypothetical protein
VPLGESFWRFLQQRQKTGKPRPLAGRIRPPFGLAWQRPTLGLFGRRKQKALPDNARQGRMGFFPKAGGRRP